MRMILSAIAWSIAVLFAGAAWAGDNDSDLKATLLELEHERLEAYVSGDQSVLEKQFAEEYLETNHHGGTTNRAQELEFYKPGVFSIEGGSISDVTVHRYGDVATLTGLIDWKNALYQPSPTAEADLSGKYRISRVYVWRGGRWQLALSHASRLP